MDRRIKKTKTAIYEAYIQIMRNHPNVKPSVKEVCAAADINKTTFYRYFTDINSLAVAIIDDVINYLLIDDIDVENLLVSPDTYFKIVIVRYKHYEADFNMLFADSSHTFIFEAERIIKSKLIETASKKYDNILTTFIAGGAAQFFLTENYYDPDNLDKFCRIIRAVVSAFGKVK